MLFVAYLYNEKLAPSSIKTYLAAIRHEQISLGLGNPQITQMPQLEYVVKGVKGWQNRVLAKRLLITSVILWQLKMAWAREADK